MLPRALPERGDSRFTFKGPSFSKFGGLRSRRCPCGRRLRSRGASGLESRSKEAARVGSSRVGCTLEAPGRQPGEDSGVREITPVKTVAGVQEERRYVSSALPKWDRHI